MCNEEESWNLETSLEGLKQIIHAQKIYIRNLEHQRDLLAEGYRVVVEKRDALEADTSSLAVQNRS